MNRDDWFRRHTWSETDRAEFFARLERSREANKGQYVRIQACELHEAGGKRYAAASLELLDLVLKKWPDPIQLASVFHQRAECYADLGDEEAALDAYRKTFHHQRQDRCVGTGAHLDFAWWVAVTGRRDLFEEACGVLDEFRYDITFPIAVYKEYGAKALMNAEVGDRRRATECAQAAVDASESVRSGLRHHTTVGLVKIKDLRVHNRLKRLAAGRSRLSALFRSFTG